MFGENKAEKEKDRKKTKDKKRTSLRNESAFQPRSGEEVTMAVKQWARHAHPRANDFFASPEQLHEVLTQLAQGIDREDDPILGPDDKCVYWYGDVTKEDLQAAIRMVKPGESAESVTFVNRVLAFIFATDESFNKLMKLPKESDRANRALQDVLRRPAVCALVAHLYGDELSTESTIGSGETRSPVSKGAQGFSYDAELQAAGLEAPEAPGRAAWEGPVDRGEMVNMCHVSWADAIAVSGAAVVEAMGGPAVVVSLGRRDAARPDGEGRLPEGGLTAGALRDYFLQLGLDDEELVALMGAHTVGRWTSLLGVPDECMAKEGLAWWRCTREQGQRLPFTSHPTVFNNEYFKDVLEFERRQQMPRPAKRFKDRVDSEKLPPLYLLPSDLGLLYDEGLHQVVKTFATDQAAFFAAFARAYQKPHHCLFRDPEDTVALIRLRLFTLSVVALTGLSA
eukprot:g14070.t1